MNPDLVISAIVDGAANVSLTKTGTGTLVLAGDNIYQGATRITAGETDIGHDDAFGNSSLVAISGGFLRSTNATGLSAADHVLPATVPFSFDSTVQVFGSGDITINGPVTLTGTPRTFTNYDPGQVTTFAGGINEDYFPGLAFTKTGRGEINITSAASFTGVLTIGSATGVQDGGTVRFSGASGQLFKNYSTIVVGVNANLILDNSGAPANNNPDRLPDQTTINLNGGRLNLIGSSAGTTETVGVVAPQNALTSVIQVDNTSGGTANLSMWNLTPQGASASVNFAGNANLSTTGSNQINILQSPTAANLPVNNTVLLQGVVINGDGSMDLAALLPGPNGFSVAPLPAEGYVTSLDLANAGSNVKITTPGTYTLDRSRTINALVLGPGVILNGAAGNDTATLTIANGPLALGNGAQLNVPYVAFSNLNPNIEVPAGANATISGIIVGTGAFNKGGAGTLTLTGANQFSGNLLINQGIVNIQHNSALGSPAGTTTVNNGAQLQLEGGITVLAEGITAVGLGPNTGTFGVGMSNTDGAVYNIDGDNQWSGGFTLGAVTTVDAPVLFPNGLVNITGSAIGVKTGTSLNITSAMAAGADIIKLAGGTLELGGITPSALNSAPRIKQGTLFLNKPAGVAAISIATSTITVGDDVSGNTATLRLGADNQIANTSNNVTIASNGTLDLNGNDQVLTNVNLIVGPLGGATLNIGSGGTLATVGTTSSFVVHALGSSSAGCFDHGRHLGPQPV